MIEELTEFIQAYNKTDHKFWENFDDRLDHKLLYMSNIHDHFCTEITTGVKEILACD